MGMLLHIYKNGENLKEKLYNNTYKWTNVDLASYSFEIEMDSKIYPITYNHTSPSPQNLKFMLI